MNIRRVVNIVGIASVVTFLIVNQIVNQIHHVDEIHQVQQAQPLSVPRVVERPEPATTVKLSRAHYEVQARQSPAYIRAQMPLSEAALAQGKRQVERMLKDRPMMRRYVEAGDPVYTYAVRMFAGAAIGTPVEWHNDPPDGDFPADHLYPVGDAPGFIRVARYDTIDGSDGKGQLKQERAGDALWSDALYELNNIRNAQAFKKVDQEAEEGKVDRQQYIERSTRLEYKAWKELKIVYTTLWLPCMRSRANPIAPSGQEDWGADLEPTYEAWMATCTDPKGYPWNCFGKYFDEEIVPYRRQVDEAAKRKKE